MSSSSQQEKQAALVAAAKLLSKFVLALTQNPEGLWQAASIVGSKVANKLTTLRADWRARQLSETMAVRGLISVDDHENLFPTKEGLGAGFLRVLLDVFNKTGGIKDGQAIGLTPSFPMSLGGSIYQMLTTLRKQHPSVWAEMGFESHRSVGLSLESLVNEAVTGGTQASRLWTAAQNARARQAAQRAERRQNTEAGDRQQAVKPQVSDDLLADFGALAPEPEKTMAAAAVSSRSSAEEVAADEFDFADESSPVEFDLELEEAAGADAPVASDEVDIPATVGGEDTPESVAARIEAAGQVVGKTGIAGVLAKKVRSGEFDVATATAKARQHLGEF